MIDRYTKIIFLLLSLFCCNQYLSAKDKYLPEEITNNKNFILKILYDNTNRIKRIHTQNTFSDGQQQEVNTIYEYYTDGFLKSVNYETKIRPDSVAMDINMKDKYDYQISDTVITITLAKKYELNGEIYVNDTLSSSKIYINKGKLPYKMISVDGYNSFTTTTDTIEYNRSNQIIKSEQTIINKWGDLSFYNCNEIIESVQQKNVFSDVQRSLFMQVPLERQWFYFFAEKAPTLVKSSTKIQDDKDADTENIHFSYKLDDNAYPIEIHAITTKEGKEPQESTLFVRYKKVNN